VTFLCALIPFRVLFNMRDCKKVKNSPLGKIYTFSTNLLYSLEHPPFLCPPSVQKRGGLKNNSTAYHCSEGPLDPRELYSLLRSPGTRNRSVPPPTAHLCEEKPGGRRLFPVNPYKGKHISNVGKEFTTCGKKLKLTKGAVTLKNLYIARTEYNPSNSKRALKRVKREIPDILEVV